MSDINKQDSSWAETLEMIGTKIYYEEHRKILEEISPNGEFGSIEWNEASAEAIIKAVAAMIEKNNTALLAEIECAKNEP